MAVEKMSAAVKAQIVRQIQASIQNRSGSITERTIKSFAEYSSRDQIRKDTDTVGGRHESIMSRGAFSTLLTDMSSAISEGVLSDELSKAVESISFDGFIEYISSIYYGTESPGLLSNTQKRTKGGFTYTGAYRNTKESAAVLASSVDRTEAYKDVLILKNIPQRKLVVYFVDYVSSNASGLSAEAKIKLNNSLQGGHLTGVFTARLIRAFGLQKESGVVSLRTKAAGDYTVLEQQLTSIVGLVTDADFLSSNIYLNLDLFLETDKRLFSNAGEVRLTTEVQFSAANVAAGNLLTQAGNSLSKLIGSVKYGASNSAQEASAQLAFKKLLENLVGVSNYIKDRVEQIKLLGKTTKLDPKLAEKLEEVLSRAKTFDTLLNTEGSPSFINHVSKVIAGAIDPKQSPKVSKSVSKVKDKLQIGPKATKVVVKNPKVVKAKIVVPTSVITRRKTVQPIVNLESILRANINQQVARNMGTGGESRILNYRSGRFSESVTIDRVSESRAGMISVFYNYMKNPYATFSTGGKQESPKTRDPKALISKSIRELAAPIVGNRLRSVLV